MPFHFSITYDPSRLGASIDRDISGSLHEALEPGLGTLHGDMQALYVRTKPTLSPRLAELGIVAWYTTRPVAPPTLAAFRREPYMRSLIRKGWLGAVVTEPQAAMLDGLPAYRFVMRKGRASITTYTMVRGDYVYGLDLTLRGDTPAPVRLALEGALRSFRVTP